MKRATFAFLLAAQIVEAFARDPGIVWPGKDMWPNPGDPMFITAKELTIQIDRDDMRLVPADQLRCEKNATECTYLFKPCEMVWARKADRKRGYIVIDVAHLRGAKLIGGRWWDLVVAKEAVCRSEIAEAESRGLKIEPWNGPGRLERRGWTVAQ